MPELLKIAVPNKGSLSEAAATMLTEAGYRQRSDLAELLCADRHHALLLAGQAGLGQVELALHLIRAWLCESE